jgi:curved DNA-binding protein CbpA
MKKHLESYFKLFGLTDISKTTETDLKQRYRKLAIRFHPDKGGMPEQFRFVKDAYECLLAERQIYIRKRQGIQHTIDKNFYYYGDGSIFDVEKNRWKQYRKYGMWFIWDYKYIQQVR